jgi:hypothetical protein
MPGGVAGEQLTLPPMPIIKLPYTGQCLNNYFF